MGESEKHSKSLLDTVRGYLGYALKRFVGDECTRMAASLSYTSLLAVVPLTAIAFAMLAAFPVFTGIREQFQTILFANFMPQSAEAMQDYFNQFVSNTASLTAVGIVGLAATAVLLLGTIESALNGIFRVVTPRPIIPRLLVFWALITLGPLVLGASFSLSTYIFALTQWSGIEAFTGPIGRLTRFTPTFMIMLLLAAFYIIIPNRSVSWRAGLVGGATAGFLFSALRQVFGYYVANFPTYQTIYGAMSVIPIFLVWMYLSWTVVLLGAVLAACMDEWRAAGGRPLGATERSAHRLGIALSILGAILAESQESGGGANRAALLRRTGAGEENLNNLLSTLKDGGLINRTEDRLWLLARDLDSTTLDDLFRVLGLDLEETELEVGEDGWRGRLAERLEGLRKAQHQEASVTLRSLLVA